jgi:hypothetical protein
MYLVIENLRGAGATALSASTAINYIAISKVSI